MIFGGNNSLQNLLDKIWWAINKHENFVHLFIQKIIGLILVAFPIWLLQNGWFYDPSTKTNDITLLCILFPVGFVLVFTSKDIVELIKDYGY